MRLAGILADRLRGNEGALYACRPVVRQYGTELVALDLNWSADQLIRFQPRFGAYHPLPDTPCAVGDVVWVAGPEYVENVDRLGGRHSARLRTHLPLEHGALRYRIGTYADYQTFSGIVEQDARATLAEAMKVEDFATAGLAGWVAYRTDPLSTDRRDNLLTQIRWAEVCGKTDEVEMLTADGILDGLIADRADLDAALQRLKDAGC